MLGCNPVAQQGQVADVARGLAGQCLQSTEPMGGSDRSEFCPADRRTLAPGGSPGLRFGWPYLLNVPSLCCEGEMGSRRGVGISVASDASGKRIEFDMVNRWVSNVYDVLGARRWDDDTNSER